MAGKLRKTSSKTRKRFSKKRSLNVPGHEPTDEPVPSDVHAQDPKRRLGQYGDKGLPHMSGKGSRGKGH